ncbi:MAG: GNAT family N-acetyltransferase [Egibacteraceae bacterium]
MTVPATHERHPTAGPPALVLTPRPYNHPDAWTLVLALHAEQLARYGFADDPHDSDPAEFAPPGVFLVGYVNGQPVACGGCRLWEATTVEIKRMYLKPAYRGCGYGRHLLRALENAARTVGAHRIILETGARNTGALALYTRAGFQSIPPYAQARDPRVNRAFAKRLPQVPRSEDGSLPQTAKNGRFANIPVRS